MLYIRFTLSLTVCICRFRFTVLVLDSRWMKFLFCWVLKVMVFDIGERSVLVFGVMFYLITMFLNRFLVRFIGIDKDIICSLFDLFENLYF